MVIFFIIYAILIFVGVKKPTDNKVLSFDQTNALKGVGIMTVFFDHIYNTHLTPHHVCHHAIFDEPFYLFESTATQLFVGMFLFFSGYGVYESLKRKGDNYVKDMPVKRIGTTLLNFDLAVVCFLIVCLILQNSFSPQQIFLSLIGWESLGNSNWYIFAILFCYLASYFSFLIFKNRTHALIMVLFLSIGYIIFMSLYKQPWWYMTILCYPAGLLYSKRKDIVNSFLCDRFFLSLVVSCVSFIILYGLFLITHSPIIYNFVAIVFSLLCIVISIRVRLYSKPLIWLGAHLFPIYIYQRLPMLVIENSWPSIITEAPYAFVIICIIITIIIGGFVPVIKLGAK